MTEYRISFREGLLWMAGEPPPEIAAWFRREPGGRSVAPAQAYGSILGRATEADIPVTDAASRFAEVSASRFGEELDPFDFQVDAIRAWEAAGRNGIIVLPTGAGKSYMTRLLIAALAMKDARCSALVIVPTRILLYQWHAQLQRAFRQPIGIVGDDLLDLQPITVTTYASARIHMAWFGDRWKLLVFDEVHRKLSDGPSANAARFSLAPFRLGLTATPVGREQPLLAELVGPVVFAKSTQEMIDRDVLSVYRRVIVRCRPTADETRTYFELRRPMDEFWREARAAHRIRGDDWFLRERRLRPDAAALAIRSVLRAHRYWGSIHTRIIRLTELLEKHVKDRVLIFAESRAAAYAISRELLIPPVTADIGGDERDEYLAAFASGTCRALVTARALEEGVDLPEANVAIILAGRKKRQSETVQYIQRRGRVLRRKAGKVAIVYEITWSAQRTGGGPDE